MFEMALTSISAFCRGRLFANNGKAFGQIGIGVSATALCFLAALKLGVPLWDAGVLAGFLGGALQPFLFKTLKYR